MALKLMFITNDEQVARMAEKNGVDWIFVDLEINGKEERQKNRNTVISRHTLEDVKKIADALCYASLLVRINPLFDESGEEIDRAIESGCDIIMLPYFKSKEEVEKFITYVDGRVKTCLLLETPEAVADLDSILCLPGIDYVHIGLNDLHLGYHKKFMFELLADGTVESLCKKIESYGIPFGFGGIAQLNKGELKAEYILAEHYRLSSSMVILSRSFYNLGNGDCFEEIERTFQRGIQDIRNYENQLQQKDHIFFEENSQKIKICVEQIVEGYA